MGEIIGYFFGGIACFAFIWFFVIYPFILRVPTRNERIDEQEKRIKQLSQQVDQLTNSLNSAQKQVKSAEDTLHNSQKANLTLQKEIDQLKTDAAKQEKRVEQLIKNIEQLTISLNTSRNQTKDAENALHDSEQAKIALEKQAIQLQNDVSTQDRLLKRLSQNIDQLTKSLNVAQNRAETAEKRADQLQKDVAFYSDIKAASEGLNDAEEELDITLDNLDAEQRAAFDLMTETNENLFITGKAGTGKSALLKVFAKETSKCVLKLAPTGIAAINVRGTTLHSAFGFDNLVKLEYDQISEKSIKLNSDRLRVLKNAVTIIIDEISMVRSDSFEKIDRILKVINGNDLPFGGKQMILFGDLFQLPPIAKREERRYLNDTFGGIYFFNAQAYDSGRFRFVELTVNHRQTADQGFFNILNNIREGTVTDAELDQINSRADFDPNDLRVATRLFAKKEDVEKFNRECLEQSNAPEFVSTARILYPEDGIYPHNGNGQFETNFPISERLRLKKGSLVMFVKNNGDKWANGTIGLVSQIFDDRLQVSVNNEEYDVFPTEFEELEAKYEKGRITYQVICKVSQYPVVLAYAMTIHKAQGQTYGKIACDVSDCFAPGQAYVALSRVKRLEGLFLLRKVYRGQIQVDSNINKFYVKNKIQSKSPDEKTAEKFRRAQEASFEIVDREGTSYRIRSGKNIYLTNSDRCTCSAFKYDPNRSTSPCKHMIWLAYHTGVLPSYYQNP